LKITHEEVVTGSFTETGVPSMHLMYLLLYSVQYHVL